MKGSGLGTTVFSDCVIVLAIPPPCCFLLNSPMWWFLESLHLISAPADSSVRAHQIPDPVDKLHVGAHQEGCGDSDQNHTEASMSFIESLHYMYLMQNPLTMNHPLESMSVPISQPEQNKDMVPPGIR